MTTMVHRLGIYIHSGLSYLDGVQHRELKDS